jgi:hypothetical protein
MIDYFFCFLLSIFCAYGLAIAVVEKGRVWPVRPWRSRLRIGLRWAFGNKFARVTECAVCFSFWSAFVADAFFYWASGRTYFAWPMSGFAAMALTWTVIEFINAVESRPPQTEEGV